eukprot:CAMPEP_0115120138 /NCGR_PEP_ID=MMETSP0227-20121206/45506_1 /TAXON_ID=89957 /ORGANISM="Polarella glacialis, Strain CCMP 1383" /LENGTH=37 /DNA_ID= /DNA_START= /DNA_END= /DNA_ORIENTATION=
MADLKAQAVESALKGEPAASKKYVIQLVAADLEFSGE